MGAVKREDSATTCRKVLRIDSKIYGVKREKRGVSVCERRFYITNNRILVKSNIQTALFVIWARFILYRAHDSHRCSFTRNYKRLHLPAQRFNPFREEKF